MKIGPSRGRGISSYQAEQKQVTRGTNRLTFESRVVED